MISIYSNSADALHVDALLEQTNRELESLPEREQRRLQRTLQKLENEFNVAEITNSPPRS